PISQARRNRRRNRRETAPSRPFLARWNFSRHPGRRSVMVQKRPAPALWFVSDLLCSKAVASSEEFRHGFDDAKDFAVLEEGVHGQAEYARTQEIGVRATRRTEFRKCFLPVQRYRVMDQSRNIQTGEMRTQLVTVRRRNDKEMAIAGSGFGLQPHR